MNFVLTVLIGLLVFSVLIFVHELGHFIAAKSAGMKVNEFAMGMGPVLISRQHKETQFSLRAFPVGGFCSVEGEDDDSTDFRAFGNISMPRRILFVVAGSAMNLLLGLIILTFLSVQMPFGSTVVADFYEDSTSTGHLMAEDEILRINGHRVRSLNDINYEFMRERDGVMDMQVKRDGEKLTLADVPFEMREVEGISYITMDFRVKGVEKTPLSIVGNAFNWTGSMVKQVWGSLIDLLTGRYGFNQLSGPVGVTTVIGEASSMGLTPLLHIVALITINLGVFNMLPLPAVDGGRLLFLLIEIVRRKPINPKYEGWVHAAGFALLIGLMITVTVNDIIKLL